MFCTNCGVPLDDSHKYCSQCGAATGLAAASGAAAAPKRLYRLNAGRKVAGVCAGFAQYLGADVTICRLAAVGATLVTGVAPGLLTYLFAWILMPVELTPPATAAYGAGPVPVRS